jgi:hypothetical protein
VEVDLKRINFGGMLLFAGTMLAFLVIGYMFGAGASEANQNGSTGRLSAIRSQLPRGFEASASKLVDRAFAQLERCRECSSRCARIRMLTTSRISTTLSSIKT